tara:strand:+ start:529 stop:1245 length:717 start_codon:yes stop_codon:yes gene_type:complete
MWKQQVTKDLTKKSKQELLDYNGLWSINNVPHVPLNLNYFKITNIKYDIEALKHDLAIAKQNIKWTNKSKDKRWKSITLKSYDGGDQSFLKKTELGTGGDNKYRYTNAMHGCKYFQKILAEIPTDIYLVRILLLEEGGIIKFHTDEEVFKNKTDIIRCHIPIITNPNIKFRIGFPLSSPAPGYEIWKASVMHEKHLEEGYMYYTNVNTLHSVVNNTKTPRYHLCIDMRPPKQILKILY